MMKYWPFLTGRVRRTGHRMVVVPDLMSSDQAQPLLGRLPAPGGGFPSAGGEILRRVVRQSPVGPVTVFYRILEATAESYGIDGEGPLHDQFGRPILLTEGIVVSGAESGAPEWNIRAALRQAHTVVAPAFRDYWEQEEGYRQISVAAQSSASSVVDDQSDGPRLTDVSEDTESGARPTDPRQFRSRSPRRSLAVLVVVALIGLISGVIGWTWWPEECGAAAGSGIHVNSEADAECIGVTAGDYLFNDPKNAGSAGDRDTMESINAVQQMIADENREVAGSERYVKVVLLMPLTVSRSRPSAMSLNQVLHSLQGTYTALIRVNHSNDFGIGSAPKVQLLLANQGSRQEASTEFLDGLVKESVPAHPVVAVVGLGSRVPQMKQAADYFGHHGIPMVSAVGASDSLTDEPLFWRISPSTTDYARALASFLDHQNALRSGVIVYDLGADGYAESLRNAYQELLRRYIKFPDQVFRGSVTGRSPAPGVLAPMVTNICTAVVNSRTPLDMIFYAGETADFGAFAGALKARPCVTRPLTVLVGGTGLVYSGDLERTLKSGNVRVVAATSSDPAAWALNGRGAPSGFAAFIAAYRESGFLDADLSDTYAIAHHDALVTAVQAIRLASAAKPGEPPNPSDVAAQFGRLNLADVVTAASGTLSLRPEGGRASGSTVTIRYLNR